MLTKSSQVRQYQAEQSDTRPYRLYGIRNVDIGFLHFLDIDVLESDDTHVLDETTGTIDVPHPRVGQPHVEVDVLAGGTPVEIDLVGQIEAALGLLNLGEQFDDVAVFLV